MGQQEFQSSRSGTFFRSSVLPFAADRLPAHKKYRPHAEARTDPTPHRGARGAIVGVAHGTCNGPTTRRLPFLHASAATHWLLPTPRTYQI